MSRMKFDHPAVALIDNTWKHFAFGEPLMAPIDDYQITREQFEMVLNKFHPIAQALEWNGYSHDQAWAYLAHVAPWAISVEVVGCHALSAEGLP